MKGMSDDQSKATSMRCSPTVCSEWSLSSGISIQKQAPCACLCFPNQSRTGNRTPAFRGKQKPPLSFSTTWSCFKVCASFSCSCQSCPQKCLHCTFWSGCNLHKDMLHRGIGLISLWGQCTFDGSTKIQADSYGAKKKKKKVHHPTVSYLSGKSCVSSVTVCPWTLLPSDINRKTWLILWFAINIVDRAVKRESFLEVAVTLEECYRHRFT